MRLCYTQRPQGLEHDLPGVCMGDLPGAPRHIFILLSQIDLMKLWPRMKCPQFAGGKHAYRLSAQQGRSSSSSARAETSEPGENSPCRRGMRRPLVDWHAVAERVLTIQDPRVIRCYLYLCVNEPEVDLGVTEQKHGQREDDFIRSRDTAPGSTPLGNLLGGDHICI